MSAFRLIVRPKMSGKTTKLIRMSANTGNTIVTMDHKSCDDIKAQAEALGLHIPDPLTIDDIISRRFGTIPPTILIDNVDVILQRMVGTPIRGVTMSSEMVHIDAE